MKPNHPLRAHAIRIGTATLLAFTVAMPQPPGWQQPVNHAYSPGPPIHEFRGWLKGSDAPVEFKSAIFSPGKLSMDTMSYVNISNSKFQFLHDSARKQPSDFDSLKVRVVRFRVTKAELRNVQMVQDTAWCPALRAPRGWAFPSVVGAISLYVRETVNYVPWPASDTLPFKCLHEGKPAYIDTGAGIEKYSREALRTKLADNPRAAKLVRGEKIGRWANYGMVGGGLLMTVAGFPGSIVTKTDEYDKEYDELSPNPLMLIGLGSMLGAWIPYVATMDNVKKAFEIYNADAAAAAAPEAVEVGSGP